MNDEPLRVGETTGRWPASARHQRVVGNDEGWFIKTREGTTVGPYLSQFDAELSAAILSARLGQASSEIECRQIILRFAHDPHHGPYIALPEKSEAQVRHQGGQRRSLFARLRERWGRAEAPK